MDTPPPSNSSTANPPPLLPLPPTLRILSLNCWGLKYISTHRASRLREIGIQIAALDPPPNIVGLQECWTQADYQTIRSLTSAILPFGKFYHSGIFGGGLVILSKWEIEESSMQRYALNGRPAAFYRGDWYVGKGVAGARVRWGKGVGDVVEVFCTHLHAPYEREPFDSYLVHRTAQAWEVARVMRLAGERGHAVVGVGDFNMLPGSLAHGVVEGHGGVRDVWEVGKPGGAVGAWADGGVGGECPSVRTCLEEHGATCDSRANTWRWSKAMKRDLKRGRDCEVDFESEDPRAKRLDYVFFSPGRGGREWEVEEVRVGMRGRHPELKCSLSDHFSVEATITLDPAKTKAQGRLADSEPSRTRSLPISTYDQILAMTQKYTIRERNQRVLRLGHFLFQIGLSIGCLIGVWWSPHNYVAFILMLLSSVGLSVGVIEGLMGGLFVGSEERALREFEWEIENAKRIAQRDAGVEATVKENGSVG